MVRKTNDKRPFIVFPIAISLQKYRTAKMQDDLLKYSGAGDFLRSLLSMTEAKSQ
jgi:hypothetical protein